MVERSTWDQGVLGWSLTGGTVSNRMFWPISHVINFQARSISNVEWDQTGPCGADSDLGPNCLMEEILSQKLVRYPWLHSMELFFPLSLFFQVTTPVLLTVRIDEQRIHHRCRCLPKKTSNTQKGVESTHWVHRKGVVYPKRHQVHRKELNPPIECTERSRLPIECIERS